MTGGEQAFALDYTPPFLAYLARSDEKWLSAAYELGRQAMRAELGVLTVVRVHHQVFLEVLSTARDLQEAQALAAKGSAFLLEAMASFEMTQRGFMAGDVLREEPGAGQRPAAGASHRAHGRP